MSTFFESTFKSSDGVHRCRYIMISLPEDTEIRGLIQISHGMCEYIDRYRYFMEYLAENGFAVCGNDHLGHGKTASNSGELGYFAPENGWQHIVCDMHKLTKIIKNRYPGVPFFLLGHSMGSFLARAYAVKFRKEAAAFVFMGTADGFESAVESAAAKNRFSGRFFHNKEKKAGDAVLSFLASQCELIGKIRGDRYRSDRLNKMCFGRTNSRIENPLTSYDWITRDRAAADAYSEDPFCTFIFTVNGFKNLICLLWYVSDDRWYSGIPKDTPILLLAGDADPIGGYGAGVRSVYNRLAECGSDVSIRIYEGARHELLNETNREEVFADILSFINDCL